VDAFAPSRAWDILGGFHFTDWLTSDQCSGAHDWLSISTKARYNS
jgi:hypothetical protein